jgi:hypothetical protein
MYKFTDELIFVKYCEGLSYLRTNFLPGLLLNYIEIKSSIYRLNDVGEYLNECINIL